MNNEEMICSKLANYLQLRDWHKLTLKERELVSDLEQSGYLDRSNSGFVGMVRKVGSGSGD